MIWVHQFAVGLDFRIVGVVAVLVLIAVVLVAGESIHVLNPTEAILDYEESCVTA